MNNEVSSSGLSQKRHPGKMGVMLFSASSLKRASARTAAVDFSMVY